MQGEVMAGPKDWMSDAWSLQLVAPPCSEAGPGSMWGHAVGAHPCEELALRDYDVPCVIFYELQLFPNGLKDVAHWVALLPLSSHARIQTGARLEVEPPLLPGMRGATWDAVALTDRDLGHGNQDVRRRPGRPASRS